jgi:hypothetical protein
VGEGAVHHGDFGEKLINDYLALFNSYSFKNELYARISLHVIVGQALCRCVYYRMGARKIDPRVHLLLIKPQGSGKGAGFGFIEDVATALLMNFQALTESTDAGLAGTTQYDERMKMKVIVPGLLDGADIVGMEEASVIFDFQNEFSKKNMTYMQITMNPLEDKSCRIVKRLGDTTIDFRPHASFVLTTYPPDKLIDKLMKTGFLDRMIPIFEDVTLADRLAIIRKMSENINISTKESFDEQKESVIKRLKIILDYYKKSEVCITIPEQIHTLMIKIIDEFAMKILDVSPKAREKLEHFITRLYEILLKLAIHHAMFEMRTHLEISDITYARMTYYPIWRNLIISIESLLIISPEERHRLVRTIRTSLDEYDTQIKQGKFVKDGVWVRRRTMIENLKKLWDNCSWETADNNLRKLEKLPESMIRAFGDVMSYEKDKYFESKDIGGSIYLRKIREIV